MYYSYSLALECVYAAHFSLSRLLSRNGLKLVIRYSFWFTSGVLNINDKRNGGGGGGGDESTAKGKEKKTVE